MNWQHVQFDWNQARAVLATYEEGSLSAAATALGLTQPTVGRQVAALEAALGIVIFERVGRGIEITPSGRDLIPKLCQMRDAAMQFSISASSQSQSIDGRVCVTASDLFASHFLPDVLRDLATIAPRLQIDIVADNALQDLQRREADIAIRHVRPTQPELFARLLGHASAGLFAHETYLSARGTPRSVKELRDHQFIGFGDRALMRGHLTGWGIDIADDNLRVTSENGLYAWGLCQAGFGIAVMSVALGRAAPGMRQILPDLPLTQFPVWLTTHRELQSSKRIRLVFDRIAAEITQARLAPS